MTKVDFYELKSGRFSLDVLISQLSLKAYERQQSLLLLTQTEQQSLHYNQVLWQFDQTHFLPHEIAPQKMPLMGINIYHQCEANSQYQILLNLNNQVPDCVGQFERAIELVHEQNKPIARDHFRYYKDRGYLVNHQPV